MEINDFLIYIQKTKRVSENTVSAYKQDLLAFKKFLRENKIMDFSQATNTQVVAYLMELKSTGKSKATVNRKLASIRAFYRFLIKANRIKENPTEGIKSPKISRKGISFLSIASSKLSSNFSVWMSKFFIRDNLKYLKSFLSKHKAYRYQS